MAVFRASPESEYQFFEVPITVRLGTNASKMFGDTKTSADRLIQDYKVDKATRDVEDTLHRLGLGAAGAVK